MNDADRLLRQALNEPPPLEPDTDEDDGDGDEPPSALLVWSVRAFAMTIVSAIDLCVWIPVFTVTNWMWPGSDRRVADFAVNFVLSGIAMWAIYTAFKRRLGWRV